MFAIFYKPAMGTTTTNPGEWARYDLTGPLTFKNEKAASKDAKKAEKLSINGRIAIQRVSR